MSRLYLSDLGMVNATGAGQEAVLAAALNGDAKGMVRREDLLVGGSVYAAAVDVDLPELKDMPIKFNSRNNRLLLAAYLQIRQSVESLIARYGCDRIAVVLGSSTSGIAETEQALMQEQEVFPDCYHYSQQEMGSPAEFMAHLLGLKNAAMTISTACSSSAKAFSVARNLIDTGFSDAALVGGVDSLCRLTLNGFNALESVSSTICKPFSSNRDGITIGEGAAIFILEPESGLLTDQIELLGIGESSDAYHMSAPQPQGIGAETAINGALSDAGLISSDISYLNLHGTATPKNDSMEASVVNRIFGEMLPCSSTKSITGHTLGAAGATELGICWLLLSGLNTSHRLPLHVWDGEWDSELDKLYLIVEKSAYKATDMCYMMSNSFAFGGSNVSLIIGRQF